MVLGSYDSYLDTNLSFEKNEDSACMHYYLTLYSNVLLCDDLRSRWSIHSSEQRIIQ